MLTAVYWILKLPVRLAFTYSAMPRSFLVKKARFEPSYGRSGSDDKRGTQHSPTKYWNVDHPYPDIRLLQQSYLINFRGTLTTTPSFCGKCLIVLPFSPCYILHWPTLLIQDIIQTSGNLFFLDFLNKQCWL